MGPKKLKRIILVILFVLFLGGGIYFLFFQEDSVFYGSKEVEMIDSMEIYTMSDIHEVVDTEGLLLGQYQLRQGVDLTDESVEFFELGEKGLFLNIDVKDVESDLYITSGDNLLIRGVYRIEDSTPYFKAYEIKETDLDPKEWEKFPDEFLKPGF